MPTSISIRKDVKFSWVVPAKFPNKAEVKSLVGGFEIECGNTVIHSDGNLITITSSKSLIDAWEAIDLNGSGYYIDEYSGYDYPAIMQGFNSSDIRIKHENGKFIVFGSVSTPHRTIGYKINGGPLKAIAFERKFYPMSTSDKNVIDIYIKPEFELESVFFSRMIIDPKKKSIKIYRKHAFPNN